MESRAHEKPARRRKRPEASLTKPVADAFTMEATPGPRSAFGFLDDDRLEELKARAFDLLADYGVVVIHPAAAAAFRKAGAKPGSDNDRLRLPRALVEEALAETPKQVRLCGKKPQLDMELPRPDGGFIARTGTGAHGYIDPRTAAYRNMDLDAVNDIAAVASGLDEVGFIAHPFVHGVPELTADIHSFARLMARTHKHIWMQPYNKENVDYLMRIAAIAAGGEAELRARPLTSVITCSFSPLEFKFMDSEVIIQAGAFGVPIHACSLPSAGGTAPLSVSGAALMAAAEIIGMTTMAHILSPGVAVIATPLMFTLDMRTGSALQACVESLQAASLAVQLMKRGFGMLTHTYGSGADTPDVDLQSMAERALLGQTVALSGADILGGLGQLECATVFSPVQAVLDNEITAMLRRFIRTPEISAESLNWEEMSAVAAGGHFLDSRHTINHCREQHMPKAFLRSNRDDYEKTGRRAAFDQARDMALELIADAPEESTLNEDQLREIAKLAAHADRHVVEAYKGEVTVI